MKEGNDIKDRRKGITNEWEDERKKRRKGNKEQKRGILNEMKLKKRNEERDIKRER